MATHSSVLAWRIPGMGEPGGLPSMGSAHSWTRRVGHDSNDSAAIILFIQIIYKKQIKILCCSIHTVVVQLPSNV